MILAGGLFATIGDGLVMATYSEAPTFYISSHVITGIPMIVLGAVLLSGGRQGEGKLKR